MSNRSREEKAVLRLILAYKANRIPVPPEAEDKIRMLPCWRITDLAQHWEARAQGLPDPLAEDRPIQDLQTIKQIKQRLDRLAGKPQQANGAVKAVAASLGRFHGNSWSGG